MRIQWVVCGDEQESSSARLQFYPAHRALIQAGHESSIIPHRWWDDPPSVDEATTVTADADLVIIGKLFGPYRERYAQCAPCSVVLAVNTTQDMDALATASDWLVWPYTNIELQQQMQERSGISLQRMSVIPDPLDPWLPLGCPVTVHERSDLQLLWIGRSRHLQTITPVVAGLPSAWSLTVITDAAADHPGVQALQGNDKVTIEQWDANAAASQLLDCDAVAITSADTGNRSSSPLRLFNGLATGKPTLAPPLQSYIDLLSPQSDHGWQACEHATDFHHWLRILEDSSQRQHWGACAQRAFNSVRPINDVGPIWVELIERIVA